MSDSLPALPKGWTWTKIEQIICDSLIGLDKRRALQSKIPEGSPYIKMNNITTDGRIITDEIVYVKISEKQQETYLLKEDDLLFNTRNSKELVGKTGIVKNILKNSIFNNNLMRIRVSEDILPDFICYQMCSPEFQRRMNLVKRATTNVAAIYGKDLFPLYIVLAPTLEQHRIVTKIEELFTKLDAGIKQLDCVKAQFNVYRQAVLKSAMTGKLTEQWRTEHKDKIEPASVLLEKIKEERKQKLGKKYKESPSVDTSNLPELPKSWKWTTIDNIVRLEKGSIRMGPFGSQLKKAELTDKGIRVLWIENIVNNRFEYGNGKFITEKKYEQLKGFTVTSGELLVTMMGTIGRVAVVPNDIGKAIISSHLLRIKLDKRICLPEYLKYCILSEYSKKQLDFHSRGVVMKGLNTDIIKSIIFPLPPLIEQNIIVEEIERHFSVIEDITKTAHQGIEQAERLRQSILKQAFEGKLVPQDPTDEPASMLLERIKAEKEKLKQTGNKKSKRDLKQQRLISYAK